MNLRSLEIHNTVEFRLFAGTGNFKILKARLEIISSLINLARVWRDVDTLITPKNLLGYMAKHGASDMALTLMTE